MSKETNVWMQQKHTDKLDNFYVFLTKYGFYFDISKRWRISVWVTAFLIF